MKSVASSSISSAVTKFLHEALSAGNYGLKFFSTPPSRTCKNILILDSSFNPPTRAHIQLCLKSIETACPQTDHLLLLLATKNADKQQSSLDNYFHRLQMMLKISQNELNLSPGGGTSVAITSASLFIDKTRLLRDYFGPECNLYFIMGYDTVVRLFDMKYYPNCSNIQEALSPLFADGQYNNYIVVSNRSVASNAQVKQFMETQINPHEMFRQAVIQVEIAEEFACLSSTMARNAINDNDMEKCKSIVPESILTDFYSNRNSQ